MCRRKKGSDRWHRLAIPRGNSVRRARFLASSCRGGQAHAGQFICNGSLNILELQCSVLEITPSTRRRCTRHHPPPLRRATVRLVGTKRTPFHTRLAV